MRPDLSRAFDLIVQVLSEHGEHDQAVGMRRMRDLDGGPLTPVELAMGYLYDHRIAPSDDLLEEYRRLTEQHPEDQELQEDLETLEFLRRGSLAA